MQEDFVILITFIIIKKNVQIDHWGLFCGLMNEMIYIRMRDDTIHLITDPLGQPQSIGGEQYF